MTANAVDAEVLTRLTTSAGQDLVRGFRRWDLWTRLGWLEVKRRYRRTVIGPFWSALSLGIFVAVFSAVGSALWGQKLGDYVPFLATGMVVWIMISSLVSEAGTLFVAGAGIFRQTRFDYSILVYALVWRNFIVFLHNLLVYVFAILIFAPHLLSPALVLVFPGLALLLVNLAWLGLLLASFCLRFRDMQQLITSLIQIAMFVTPIFWPPDSLQGAHRLVFVELNPLYHMIDVVRAPLIGKVPGIQSYEVSVLVAVIGWLITYLAFSRFRRRLPYWS
jgi:ABC-type polysaccharide/polyol phosphate export permease